MRVKFKNENDEKWKEVWSWDNYIIRICNMVIKRTSSYSYFTFSSKSVKGVCNNCYKPKNWNCLQYTCNIFLYSTFYKNVHWASKFARSPNIKWLTQTVKPDTTDFLISKTPYVLNGSLSMLQWNTRTPNSRHMSSFYHIVFGVKQHSSTLKPK